MKKSSMKQMPVRYIIPLLLIAAIVPVIVFLKVRPIDSVSYEYWIGEENNSDFFSYYKAILTIILSSASLVVFLYAKYKKLIDIRQLIIYYIPIAIYVVTILLSSLLSKYPNTAWIGFVDRYEGAFVLLSYLTILFTTINLVNNVKLVRVMFAGLVISAIVIGMIGIFQFFGMDFFKSEFGKSLIIPSQYRKFNLTFNFGAHTIYSTLYNTNYVGSFMAMLFPLSLGLFLYIKDWKNKIAVGAFACLMFANWFGCRSRGGYIGCVFALIILVILLRKLIIKNVKPLILLIAAFLLIFIGMNSAANGELGGRIITTITNIGNEPKESEQTVNKALLNDIVLKDKKASIVYGNDTLSLVLNGSQLEFQDTNGKMLDITKDDQGNIRVNDERYKLYNIKFDQANNLFDFNLNNMKFSLYLDPSGFKIVGERGILLTKVEHPESIGFEGREKFGSMRGYIWSRSTPLLKNNIVIGGGPDTFVMQFPQHDYIGKLRAFDMVNQIVDKPHNMYLQIGINTGVVSLLAVLFLFIAYFISSVKLYFRKLEINEISLYGSALLAAVVGYAVSTLANDSLVSVAPVFWIILGLGISCNYLYKKENQVIDKENNIKLHVSKYKKN